MRLSGFKYFSSLDLFAGYHQVPMSEESVPYTAFVTQDGQYESLRMPFGLCNAPAVFQRMINNVLGQHRFTKVLCYLHDLLIPATTLEESLAVLRETLEMLRTAGLTLKLSKCYFLRTTIEYLGYVISEAGVQPSNLKIDAVDNFPTPQNVQEIQKILQSGNQDQNKDVFSKYALKRGKVYRITETGLRWVVPKANRFQILQMSHDDVGHFAFDKTHELVSSKYWFKRMRQFIDKYVRSCLNCLYFKTPGGKPQGFLHPIKKEPKPFHTVHVDHVGPFIKTKTGKTQVLVMIDAFTKFILLYAVKSTRAKFAINSLNKMIKVFGAPRRIICDKGKAFDNHAFKTFCQEHGIRIHYNA
jgi:hypothetical protein